MAREKILIIDDEEDVCNVLKETLEYEGYSAQVAASGEKALELIGRSHFQVLLVDMRLAGNISGVEVIRHFKGQHQQPAIFVISATPKALLEPLFEKEGITDLVLRVLEKPADLNPDKFPTILKNALKK